MAVPSYRAIFEANVPAKMRDGCVLFADVWRPDTPGRYPVLLQRTPYDKQFARVSIDGAGIYPMRAVSQGYVVIIQDTRGRWESEGDFYPYLYDFDDGYDAVEWAASLPYSNGRVGMYGVSYVGSTQWMAAVKHPPHLKAIFPQYIGDGAYEGTRYVGGAFQLGLSLYWVFLLAPDTLLRKAKNGQDVSAIREELLGALNALPRAFDRLPLQEAYSFLPELAPYYLDWLAHPENGEYWERWRYSRYFEQIAVPAYNLGGWYDYYNEYMLRNFNEMRRRGGSEEARCGQKVIMGPWAHSSHHDYVGELFFGLDSTRDALDPTGLHLRWFDYWLKGENNGILDEPPIKLFVMGANVWRNENEWPLARTRWTDYYLRSQGRANSAAGDGVLSPTPLAADQPPDIYVYDPRNPAPTVGGCTLLPGNTICANAGPKEQSGVEGRDDVLVYTSSALEQDVEVTGPITVTIFASTSARDTDWTAKLTDVHPDGRSYNLAEGIIRARYREGTDVSRLVEPDRVYEYNIGLQCTSNVFKSGHRIRLQVSSSNYPRFNRNPNTGRAMAMDTELQPALQTVFHDPARPSRITLPIIPRD